MYHQTRSFKYPVIIIDFINNKATKLILSLCNVNRINCTDTKKIVCLVFPPHTRTNVIKAKLFFCMNAVREPYRQNKYPDERHV